MYTALSECTKSPKIDQWKKTDVKNLFIKNVIDLIVKKKVVSGQYSEYNTDNDDAWKYVPSLPL